MIMKAVARSHFLILLCVFSYAEELGCPEPVEFVESSVVEMMDVLKQTCELDPSKERVKKEIADIFIPHVDVGLITKQVLGRQYWRDTSDEDKEALEDRLRQLLAMQYAEAFNCDLLDNDMVFHPHRGEAKRYSRVESTISLDEKTSVLLRYAVRCDHEIWRIYDIVIDGLSLAQTYRSQFHRILQQGGVHTLISYLDRQLTKEQDDIQD
jgi:phospholipid transport system substrate-binding protein